MNCLVHCTRSLFGSLFLIRPCAKISGMDVEVEGGTTINPVHSDSVGAKPKRFELKKWNAVALWTWDICVENCAICSMCLHLLRLTLEETKLWICVSKPKRIQMEL